MRRWAECQTEEERRATFVEAEQLCQGRASALAVVLAVDRRQVYRMRERYGAAPATPRPPAEAVRITLDLPRRCIEWLDQEALRRKQRAAEGRPAKSPIVVELIEREMAAPPPVEKPAAAGARRKR